MSDCKAKILVTADGAWRGEKLLVLKKICDEALQKAKVKYNHTVKMCIVVSHLNRVTPCGKLEDPKSLVNLLNTTYCPVLRNVKRVKCNRERSLKLSTPFFAILLICFCNKKPNEKG